MQNLNVYGIIQDTIYLGYNVSANVIGKPYNLYRSATAINPLVNYDFTTNLSASFNVSWDYKKANKYGNAVYQALVDGRQTRIWDILQISSSLVLNVTTNVITITGTPSPYLSLLIIIDGKDYGYIVKTADTLDSIATNFAAIIPMATATGNTITIGGVFTTLQAQVVLDTWYIAAMQLMLPILAIQCNHFVTVTRQTQNDGNTQGQYFGYTPATATTIASNVPCSILFGNKGSRNEQKLPSDTHLGFWTILLPYLDNTVYENKDIIIDENEFRYVVDTAELTTLGWRIMARQLGT